MITTLLALVLTQANPAAPPAAPATPPPAAPAPPAAPRGTDVAGNWAVDLRVADNAEAYNQPMMLVIAADSTITGTFYGSPILSGRYGRNRGRSCVAFVTSDGAGPYQHAACLMGGQMVGQSWAEHRQFVLPWVAARAPTP